MSRSFAVKLVNMPFGLLRAPSLALTQLAAVVRKECGARVAVDVHPLTFDFADFIGDEILYDHAHSAMGFMTDFGNWFFSRAAFPGSPNNREDYLARYYFEDDTETRRVRDVVRRERDRVEAFLDLVIDRYDLLHSDVVGCSLLFFQTTASLALARRLKERKADLTVVIGGASCEGSMGQELARQVPFVDFVFSGPGLVSFPRFLECRLAGNPDACHRIDGVFSRRNLPPEADTGARGSGTVAPSGSDRDINDVVELDYEPFLAACEARWPEVHRKPILLFETSRGCWRAEKEPCSFCGLNGLRRCYRAMSADKAVAHIESLYRYAGRAACFVAVDNIMPPNYPQEVFARLRPPKGFAMKIEVRADLDGDDLRRLGEAGVVAVQPGIESLSTLSLGLMRKGRTAFDNVRFLKECSRHPLAIEWNLLLFSPGEPEAVCEKALHDLPLLTHLPPPQGAFPVMVVRHSRYVEQARELGLVLRPQETYRYVYPFGDASIARLANHFVDDGVDMDRMDRWLDRLNGVIASWQGRWTGRDGAAPARLSFLPGRSVISDSRSGKRKDIEISEHARRVLGLLDVPLSVEDVANRFASEPGLDVDGQIRFLDQHGLLFAEDGRYLSLVV